MSNGRTLYLDCQSGISGDMLLGSLLDLGAPLEELLRWLRTLPLPVRGFSLLSQEVMKCGMRATRCLVQVPRIHGTPGTSVHMTPGTSVHEADGTLESSAHGRGLGEILPMIDSSKLPEKIKERGNALFTRLASVEGKIHGVSPEDVHFHELGGWDTVVDLMGSLILLDLLKIHEIVFSPLNVGCGLVETAHGTLPIPAPATLELLRGVPIYSTGIKGELVTPTGALLLTSLGKSGEWPLMTVEKIGYGAGSFDLPIPNILRAAMGERQILPGSAESSPLPEDQVYLLETNLDDMNPQWFEPLFQKLFTAGALDVSLTPLVMKKGRPGVQLSVLTPPQAKEDLITLLFQETTTLGVRIEKIARRVLARETVEVETPLGNVVCKIARNGGKLLNVSPEFESCRRLAEKHLLPLKKVYEEVTKALAFYQEERAPGKERRNQGEKAPAGRSLKTGRRKE